MRREGAAQEQRADERRDARLRWFTTTPRCADETHDTDETDETGLDGIAPAVHRGFARRVVQRERVAAQRERDSRVRARRDVSSRASRARSFASRRPRSLAARAREGMCV